VPIYELVKVIDDYNYHYIRNLSFTFPSGNGYIDVVLAWLDGGFREVWKIKLDPEASTKIPLTMAPKNET
jgi:hypothetical protein